MRKDLKLVALGSLLLLAGIIMASLSMYRERVALGSDTLIFNLGPYAAKSSSYQLPGTFSLLKIEFHGGCSLTLLASYKNSSTAGLDCKNTETSLVVGKGRLDILVTNYGGKEARAAVRITKYAYKLPYSMLSLPAYFIWLLGFLMLILVVISRFSRKSGPANES